MKKINIAELLKDCPSGMELDCRMFEGLEFDSIVNDSTLPIRCRLKNPDGKGYNIYNFTKYGCWTIASAKCVIFPKGKTTWEGFVPPCNFKDGDIIYIKNFANKSWISIYKKIEDNLLFTFVDISLHDNKFLSDSYLSLCEINTIVEQRIATEEEKNKLFDVIKENGCHWNSKTKSLEKLISDKFDINTLVPFESRVLVRDDKSDFWKPAIYGYLNHSNELYPYCVVGGEYYKQLIPFAGNEHFLGTIDDCDDFYKTWNL